jgi:hypothetical protein
MKLAWLVCALKGHDAVIRDDMIIDIPARDVQMGGRILHYVGRRIPIGYTHCLRCKTPLYVEGVVVRPV